MSAPQRPGPPSWPNQQQPYGQPGQTEWIPRVSEQRRDEPFLFEEPQPEPPPNPVATWALRIAGLVVVAVLSGVVYAYLQDDSPENPPAAGGDEQVNEVPAGRFEFTPHKDMPEPRRDTDCAANSRDKVKQYFQNSPCTSLTRVLYTSTPEGQDKLIYTWVAVVQMPTPEAATGLHELAQTSNTGNVTDPFIGKIVTVEGISTSWGLGRGGYASQLNGSHVIIVESDWAPSAKRTAAQDEFLTSVSNDALRYGTQFVTQG